MIVKLTEAQYNKLISEQGDLKFDMAWNPEVAQHQKNKKSSEETEKQLDTIQSILDWAGLIPLYGDALDAFNAVLYFSRKKPIEGSLSIIAIIPVVGSVVAIPFKVLFRLLGKVSAGLNVRWNRVYY